MSIARRFTRLAAAAVAVVLAVAVGSAFAQNEAIAKSIMAEAPRVLAAFESMYLSALAEMGDDVDITKNDLMRTFDDLDSDWFKYEYVTYTQGGIVGSKATALMDIGKFNKGNFLQTVYQKDRKTFTHCVGGNGANMSVVKGLIPNFNVSVECGSVNVKKASGSAQSAAPSVKKGSFTDSRDKKVYKTVKIGDSQTWMAENLNYAAKGSVCYENSAANCAKYGRLYDWKTALTACPAGTHLPSDAEWSALMVFVGDKETAGKKLKSVGGWTINTDEFGFSALPGGYGLNGNFDNAGSSGFWWNATEYSADGAYNKEMSYNHENVSTFSNNKNALFSVRCVQDVSRDSRLVNKKGEAWTRGYCKGGYCEGYGMIFVENGNFTTMVASFRTDIEDDDNYNWSIAEKGTWYTDGNKIIMISDDGKQTIESYNITSSTKITINGLGLERDKDITIEEE